MLTKLRKYGVQPIVATQSVDDVRAACRGPAKSEEEIVPAPALDSRTSQSARMARPPLALSP